MQVDLPETTSKIGGPLVRQFSVFLPNKVGAMLEVVKLLNAHATHVVALSVSESTDAAIATRHLAVNLYWRDSPRRVPDASKRPYQNAFVICVSSFQSRFQIGT